MNTWEWIQEHSTLVLLLVGGLLVGILFLKKTPPQTATPTTAGADLSGLAMDASGHPIVYRAVSDTFITENVSGSYNSAAQDATQSVGTAVNSPTTTSTTTTIDNHSAPIEHPIEPQPTAAIPTDGLLGPAIQFVPPASYKDRLTGKVTPIPLPSGTKYISGVSGRMWYQTPGSQLVYLLTSGQGGPVTNSPHHA